jgi:23S rRNA (adenine1618-N6)-methyltransferase
MAKQALHPRNPHQGLYDFEKLIKNHPPLQKFLEENDFGQLSIDFANPKAVLALNTALLVHFYDVEAWTIPAGYLCPPIPGRADYIHYAADLLASSNEGQIPIGPQVTCLDIGTGANLIYPIIGIRAYHWRFIGAEVDDLALASARNIQKKNDFLKAQLSLKKQPEPHSIFKHVLSKEEYIDLSICNPPFYESQEKATRATLRKQRNLKQKLNIDRRNFGGQQHELWYPGGERTFISRMIAQSQAFAKNCCWFTSLVAQENHLPKLYKELEKVKPVEVKTIDMGQGNKRSRILAWTYLTKKQQKAWANYRWSRTSR